MQEQSPSIKHVAKTLNILFACLFPPALVGGGLLFLLLLGAGLMQGGFSAFLLLKWAHIPYVLLFGVGPFFPSIIYVLGQGFYDKGKYAEAVWVSVLGLLLIILGLLYMYFSKST